MTNCNYSSNQTTCNHGWVIERTDTQTDGQEYEWSHYKRFSQIIFLPHIISKTQSVINRDISNCPFPAFTWDIKKNSRKVLKHQKQMSCITYTKEDNFLSKTDVNAMPVWNDNGRMFVCSHEALKCVERLASVHLNLKLQWDEKVHDFCSHDTANGPVFILHGSRIVFKSLRLKRWFHTISISMGYSVNATVFCNLICAIFNS